MFHFAHLGLGLALLVPPGPLAPPARAEAGIDYAALYDRMAQVVAENFYDPSLRGVDWPAAVARHRGRAASATSDAAFRRAAEGLLAELRSSHLDLRAPSAETRGWVGVGARLKLIDGALTVVEVSEASDAARKGLRPGDQILDRAAVGGTIGTIADLRVRGCDGAVRSLAVRRQAAFWPPQRPTFRWRMINGGSGRKLGYLRVDAFEDDGAPLADQAMAELAEADVLVIDVRANSGGNASALRLASYFTDGAVPTLALLTRPYLAALGRTATPQDVLAAPRVERLYTSDLVFSTLAETGGGAVLWTEDLGDKRYRGPVYLLLGEDTASAAEGFAWGLRLRTNAVLVGRPSEGALLGASSFDIGQGWSLRVPVQGIWAADGEDYGDRSVPPHVAVEWTRADLCQGRDPDMDRALALIEAGFDAAAR